jgi:hypothetical protein
VPAGRVPRGLAQVTEGVGQGKQGSGAVRPSSMRSRSAPQVNSMTEGGSNTSICPSKPSPAGLTNRSGAPARRSPTISCGYQTASDRGPRPTYIRW